MPAAGRGFLLEGISEYRKKKKKKKKSDYEVWAVKGFLFPAENNDRPTIFLEPRQNQAP